MANLQNTDMVKGSAINLFYNNKTFAFATNHQLQVNLGTTEVSTKDHGDYTVNIPTVISWNLTADNVYTTDDGQDILTLITAKQPITVNFCEVANYSATDEHGIVMPGEGLPAPSGVQSKEWTPGTTIAQGVGYITSYQLSAQAGERATYSITIDGVGEFTHGAQGAQGAQA